MSSTLQDAPLGDVPFTEEDFTAIAAMVREASGIMLGPTKRDLIYGRLRRRLRALSLGSFAAYRAVLDGEGGAEERVRMINAVTTNLTGFFREKHHFEHLARQLLPSLSRQGHRLRIWSAGCSSGEEPYSLALTLLGTLPDLAARDARILATDIDTSMVETAATGRYPVERLAPVPEALRGHHLLPREAGQVEMGPEAKALITFRSLNLLGPWPMRGPFDVIFCRNVVIYFDKPTQRKLFDRYADILVPGGHLYIGHSESLFRVSERFQHLGRTIYRKLR
ncbi:CheR family methyltransferase [Paeniroseomonas aquatica]|uniref:Chemotaxis protein methyltransferase n=1 Tax=Paeniroseomonas aquatica TaxID=373043 RepID=A0ABT8AG51_9PROT|nr:protein-glutamate O-methyltransferase CheR [Paeniroseomonas aquatica]MDN3568802.1 protein-glutamate O-methyltransferase CheR [Paeniroseomonas aquatica]